MSVTSVSTATDTTAYTSSSTSNLTLGKEDFLTILVAQLENQDPLDPQDSAEFISQMAQFSSLEQQIQTNENLDTLIESAGNTERYAAFQLLGTEVVASSDSFSYTGSSVELGFSLDEAADEVEISILDASNTVVATLNAGQAEAGANFVTWDGTTDAGAQLASGAYSFAVKASDDGTEIDTTPLIRTVVKQVSLDTTGSVLVTGAGEFSLSDLTSVSQS